jgi:hypothetical protein
LKILRDIEQYYSTQIDEMPMNVAELVWLALNFEFWIFDFWVIKC